MKAELCPPTSSPPRLDMDGLEKKPPPPPRPPGDPQLEMPMYLLVYLLSWPPFVLDTKQTNHSVCLFTPANSLSPVSRPGSRFLQPFIRHRVSIRASKISHHPRVPVLEISKLAFGHVRVDRELPMSITAASTRGSTRLDNFDPDFPKPSTSHHKRRTLIKTLFQRNLIVLLLADRQAAEYISKTAIKIRPLLNAAVLLLIHLRVNPHRLRHQLHPPSIS